jgi:hypothetical protein
MKIVPPLKNEHGMNAALKNSTKSQFAVAGRPHPDVK